MQAGITLFSIVPVGAEASEASEQVTQLLFGETYNILEQNPKWTYIEAHWDQYRGWIDTKLSQTLSEQLLKSIQQHPRFTVESIFGYIEHKGTEVPVLLGSELPLFNMDEMQCELQDERYVYQGLFKEAVSKTSRELLVKTAMRYLGAPYLWGGRTVLGVDCSGFSQIVYKLNGIPVQRDASQQAKQGIELQSLSYAQPGDLAFFTNSKGRIAHVGIILPDNQIIHGYGHVRIDPINDKGIFSHETGQQTHTLAQISTYIP